MEREVEMLLKTEIERRSKAIATPARKTLVVDRDSAVLMPYNISNVITIEGVEFTNHRDSVA